MTADPRGKIEMWEAGNGRWYFHKRNRNGRTTNPSQGYTRRDSARKAAKRDIGDLQITVLTAGRTEVPPS